MKAVFLDRDGTIIVDPPDFRVDSVDELELFPDTLAALKLLTESGFKVVIISSQAGIGEGRFSLEEFNDITERLYDMLAPSGVQIIGNYVCPHRADENCDCRKPKPKLILDAARELGISLNDSFMVGDRETDIEAGINAGTKTLLVQTGNVLVEQTKADHTSKNLLEAVEYIIGH